MIDEPKPRRRVQHKGGGLSKTRQADALNTDINTIMKKYVAHGILPRPPGTARYGDFSSGLDFKTAMDAVTAAQSNFMELPSHIRSHCRNDAGEFLDMVFDPARKAELEELGMLPQADPTLPAPEPEATGGETPSTQPEE